MNSNKQITVIGATGNLGAPVVKNLSNAGFRIKIIARNLEKAEKMFKDLPEIEIVGADLTDVDSLKTALKNTTYLYLSLSTTSVKLNIPFAAEREGVANILEAIDKTSIRQIILISGLGALDNFKDANSFEFIPNIIRKQGHKLIKNSGIPYTILHCSWFLDCFVFYRRKGTYSVIGNNRVPIYFTNCYDYTFNVIRALDNPEALFREFPIQGVEGLIHSEAAERFLSVYAPSSKVSLLPSWLIRTMAIFNIGMKFVKHMSDYTYRCPEQHLSEDFGAYEILGQPVMDVKTYAAMLKQENSYGYLNI